MAPRILSPTELDDFDYEDEHVEFEAEMSEYRRDDEDEELLVDEDLPVPADGPRSLTDAVEEAGTGTKSVKTTYRPEDDPEPHLPAPPVSNLQGPASPDLPAAMNPEAESRRPPRKPPARKTTPPAKKAAPAKPVATAKKGAKKAPAPAKGSKRAPARAAKPVKKTAPKKAAPKKAAPKRAAQKKAVVKKVAPRKAAKGRTAVKKAATKRRR